MAIRKQIFVSKGFDLFSKYVFLVVCALINILYIITLFSNYTVRREVEATLSASSADTSIDTLIFNANSETEIAHRLQEYRCLQKDAIAFYRFSTMDLRKEMGDVYVATLSLRDAVRQFIKDHESLIDPDKTSRKLDSAWGIPLPSDLIFRQDAKFDAQKAILEQFQETLDVQVKKLKAEVATLPSVSALFASQGHAITDMSAEALKLPFLERRQKETLIFDFTFIDKLEAALQRMRVEFHEKGLDALPTRDALIRKLSADDSLLNDGNRTGLLEEFSRNLAVERQNDDSLKNLDCSVLDASLRRELELTIRADAASPAGLSAVDKAYAAFATLRDLPQASNWAVWAVTGVKQAVYDAPIRSFVRFPTAAQTLIVTMLFGSLGALCLQGLRLSNRGYWGTVSDPRWGEIVMSLALGMAAAIIVYLLSSIGVLIISDRPRDAQQLSTVGAAFVALLGFISGLLNDDAFGRIRQFGLETFRGTRSASDPRQTTPDDVDFCQRLEDADCHRFAELASIHGLGTRLAGKAGFTLLVPADAVFDAMPLADWRALSDPEHTGVFDALLNRHLHDLETLTFANLQKCSSLTMADGHTLPVAAAPGAPITIGTGIEIKGPTGFTWRAGIFFISSGMEP